MHNPIKYVLFAEKVYSFFVFFVFVLKFRANGTGFQLVFGKDHFP